MTQKHRQQKNQSAGDSKVKRPIENSTGRPCSYRSSVLEDPHVAAEDKENNDDGQQNLIQDRRHVSLASSSGDRLA